MPSVPTEVSQDIYEGVFNKIYDWFQSNSHAIDLEHYRHTLLPLKHDYRRVCDIISTDSGGVHFRVIIKATYDDVTNMATPPKDFRDLEKYEMKSNPPITYISARQVCYIQLDKNNNPVKSSLVVYSYELDKNTVFGNGQPS